MTRSGLTALLAAALLLAGCAGPPAPDWKSNAHTALERFESAALRGDTDAADSEFELARAELARTGRPELVAHAELVRCAIRTASLDFDDCPGFAPLAGDAGVAARSYADYLAGRWDALDAALLPEPQRAIPGATDPDRALGAIDSPVSRLVAAGVLLRTGKIQPEGIALAIETASEQGWRRPLAAWLAVAERRALAAGDADAAATIRRRLDLVLDPR